MDTPVMDGVFGGRYRLAGRIGRGGMADVYEGRDERLDRPVAIKVLRPELTADPGWRRRFEGEARTAARLAHPNVVTVYDSGDDAGQAYLVMERVVGETLADCLTRGSIDESWVHAMAADVLAGLSAAHGAGIIHRDIKPGNILITADGKAKVTDFGIAKAADAPGTRADIDVTVTGMVIGTPGYLAPERAQGQPATVQSDLYSVGVVLYEALVGRKPFDPPTPLATSAATRWPADHDQPWLPAGADRRLVAAIRGALHPDPRVRFQTAKEMARTLDEPASAPTAVLPDVGPGPRQRRRSRRRVAALAAAAVIAIAVAVVLAARPHPGGTTQPTTTVAATNATTAAPTTTAASTTPLIDAGAAALHQLASALTVGDGDAYPTLAAGLDRIADLAPTARPAAATVLLAQATGWYRSHQLTAAAYAQAVHALSSVGGSLPPATPAGSKRHGGHKGGGD